MFTFNNCHVEVFVTENDDVDELSLPYSREALEQLSYATLSATYNMIADILDKKARGK